MDAGIAPPAAVLERWNHAHAQRDANALRSLYASVVTTASDREVPGSDLVRRKAALFARAPEATQSIHDSRFIADGSGGTYVQFSQTSDLRVQHHARRLKAFITDCPQLCANVDPRGPMADPPCKTESGAYAIAVIEPSSFGVLANAEVDAMSGVVSHWSPISR